MQIQRIKKWNAKFNFKNGEFEILSVDFLM